jgi:hypothetical protein
VTHLTEILLLGAATVALFVYGAAHVYHRNCDGTLVIRTVVAVFRRVNPNSSTRLAPFTR